MENLTKRYSRRQVPAVDSLSFAVGNGEIVGFVGLNGAGKTTTIRIAAGVTLLTSGSVLVDSYDVVEHKVEASRQLGWVPEFPNFEPNAKATSLMRYFAGFYGMQGREAETKIAELLKTVGLAGFENRKLRTYSQGMKKRFSLASSMLSDPPNYLFDEILNGLDPEGIHYMRQLMADFRRAGKAVLLSSHILMEVESIADRVLFIHKGRLIKTITHSELAGLGGSSLKVTIRGVDRRALSYLEGLGEARVEGDTVYILGGRADPAKVNSDLLSMGYTVTELSPQHQGLEDYFMKLIAEQEGVKP